MDLTRARAAAGSRNSSTNFIRASSGDLRVFESLDLVEVVLAHLLDLVKSHLGLQLIDLRHREADVHQHPIAGCDALLFEQLDTDDALDAADVDLGQRLRLIDDADDLAGDSQTHGDSFLVAAD